MPKNISAKISINHYLTVLLLLLSCNEDIDLLNEYVLDTNEVIVTDDIFRVPSNMTSILDVLANDTFISGNVRIVETSTPSHGDIFINEDNTITYTPWSAATSESQEETTSGETGSGTEPTEENSGEETESRDTEENSEETNTQEASSEDQSSEEQTSQSTGSEHEQTEENNTQEASSEDESSEDQTSQSTGSEDEHTEGESNEETTSSGAEQTTNEADEESEEDESSDSGENSSEEVNNATTEEDTFTYTTETENEDGTTTTETGTVIVEVEDEQEATPEAEPIDQEDYWRDPVIAGTRLLDEKYYDLDTDEVYAKEVNLQRGQVENYIEHENCPQRIKDKWANRIEVTPTQVNGSQEGLNAIFKSHPRGSLFYLRAGVYQNQKHAVLDVDQDVVGEYGAILDGSGIQPNSADDTRAIRSLQRGFICNLVVREYPTWRDPLYPENPRGAALEAIQQSAILNCEVHSHNKAIAINYSSKAMWNKFTAGRLGIHSVGTYDPNDPNRRGTVVKYNEWYDCNFNNYAYGHEAGGSKFVQLDGAIYSHNYIHDNPTGPGIWEDGDNRDSEIYNNVIINTDRSIFSEISHTSNIHHNTIEYGMGFGGIQISNSRGDKVHHNYVRWCRNGITINELERGNSKIYPSQAWRSMNNEVYDNYIWQETNATTWTHGVATLFDGRVDENNISNQWRNNHYYIDDHAEGAALFSQEIPFTLAFMYSKLADDGDNNTISWEDWKNISRDTNSSLEYVLFF